MTDIEISAPTLSSRPVMSQFWRDLAFLHWFVEPSAAAPFMPAGAAPDVLPTGRFQGLTPVALVPFRMVGAGFGNGPAVPYFGTFWETNVRLYSVDAAGRHGVVFRSLDASRLAVVLAARGVLGLPYRFSAMRGYERQHRGARELGWTTRTRWPGDRGINSRVAVRVGPVVQDFRTGSPDAGGVEDHLAAFLTARWGLHTSVLGSSLFIPNEHPSWTLRSAEVLVLDDELLAAAGFPGLVDRPPDHVCFAEGVRTTFGLPQRNLGRHRR
ncbi:MAG: DUF2071 domain-containing protein [Nakamurella sp.]